VISIPKPDSTGQAQIIRNSTVNTPIFQEVNMYLELKALYSMALGARLNTMSRDEENKKSKKHSHSLEEALNELKKSGLKVTQPRKAILEALARNHGPFTADEVHKLLNKIACDQATVYRTLTSLEQVGILRRCEFGDGTARFELSEPGGHHHHIVCNTCKRVEIIEDKEIEEIDRFAKRRGFSNISHILEFFGTCPQCK
jgi:Fur family transcriptional regulator, ferric uptake regulator